MTETLKHSKILSREQRLVIVNEIIKEISVRGRRFFHHEGLTAELVIKKRIYYKAEYGSKKLICLSVPDYRRPVGWFHGGTLLSLIKELKDFVMTGNKRDEFTGLNSPHWGYPEIDMVFIREKAKQLGYLQ